jgi:hypothetical protein
MAQLSSGMMERKLDSLFEMVTTNELALPELQRASVWGNSMVPRLISSVYEDYPFGILLFWTAQLARTAQLAQLARTARMHRVYPVRMSQARQSI